MQITKLEPDRIEAMQAVRNRDPGRRHRCLDQLLDQARLEFAAMERNDGMSHSEEVGDDIAFKNPFAPVARARAGLSLPTRPPLRRLQADRP